MKRLDAFLFENGTFSSRNKAAEAIKRGEIIVNGKKETKPSKEVTGEENIEIIRNKSFVSLGGYKLDRAADAFTIRADGLVFADIGASTGGFTDCLLKRGAKKVYAVDVGENLLHPSLRSDKRVIPIENFNARYLTEETLGEKVDGVVVDCSFISLKIILPPLKNIIKENGFIIALVKPQFECGEKNKLGKSGILRSDKEIERIIFDLVEFSFQSGLVATNIVNAPVYKDKNKEFLLKLSFDGVKITEKDIKDAVLKAKEEI